MQKIQKNIKRAKRGKSAKYPFEDMKIGDSLRFNGTTRTGPYVLAARANLRFKAKVFAGGYDKNGVGRVWREA